MLIKKCLLYCGVLFIGFSMLAFSSCSNEPSTIQHLKIGWQIPLATQGQIVQVLKNTKILKDQGFEAEFIPFSFGSPQVEAAKSGDLDIIFVGDQPALNLIGGDAPWKLTSVLFETRVAIMTSPNSTVSLDNLNGAKIASPFGSVAHREAIFLEQDLGLNPNHDVKNLNVDILEIGAMVQSGLNWPNIDAIAVWEPSVTLFKEKGLARSLKEVKTLGVVAASNKFLENRDAARRFQLAVNQAWEYLLKNTEKANGWYIQDTGLNYTNEFLLKALSVDRNGAKGNSQEVNLQFTDSDILTLKRGMEWAKNQGYIKRNLSVEKIIWK